MNKQVKISVGENLLTDNYIGEMSIRRNYMRR
jgi:hypothetical protein